MRDVQEKAVYFLLSFLGGLVISAGVMKWNAAQSPFLFADILSYSALNFLAYFMGSIPFGYVLVRVFHGKDIRHHGSKNIGATNVWRICGPALGISTFLLDAGKAGLVFLVLKTTHFSAFSSQNMLVWAGFFAFIGHIFPVWFHFKGGKGIAILFGFMLAWNPLVFLIMAGVWGSVFLVTRQSFLGGLSCSLVPLSYALWKPLSCDMIVLFSSVFLIVLWRHTENIRGYWAAKKGKDA